LAIYHGHRGVLPAEPRRTRTPCPTRHADGRQPVDRLTVVFLPGSSGTVFIPRINLYFWPGQIYGRSGDADGRPE
jgi:hypothetical protein